MKFHVDPRTFPNGTVLLFGISYPGQVEGGTDANRGMTPPKVFTYGALKAGGLWYFTGAGRVPVAAGWLAVEKWLERDGRVVETIHVVTDRELIFQPPRQDES